MVDRDSRAGGKGSFRRNRTLTDGTDQSAASRSERAVSHTLRQRRRKLRSYLVAILIAASGLAYLVSQLTVKSEITLASPIAAVEPQKSYARSLNTYYHSHPAERFRFALDEANLRRALVEKHPEIDRIEMTRGNGIGVSRLIITPRRPVARWTVDGQMEYVDGSGIAFKKNYYDEPGVAVIDNSGLSPYAGNALVSGRILSFIGQTVGLSGTFKLQVQQVLIPPQSARTLEFRFADIKPLIKMTIDRPAGEQLEDAAHAIRWLDARSLSPGYVDVRVSGKAYYR